jgi:hypothetical protein
VKRYLELSYRRNIDRLKKEILEWKRY